MIINLKKLMKIKYGKKADRSSRRTSRNFDLIFFSKHFECTNNAHTYPKRTTFSLILYHYYFFKTISNSLFIYCNCFRFICSRFNYLSTRIECLFSHFLEL